MLICERYWEGKRIMKCGTRRTSKRSRTDGSHGKYPDAPCASRFIPFVCRFEDCTFLLRDQIQLAEINLARRDEPLLLSANRCRSRPG